MKGRKMNAYSYSVALRTDEGGVLTHVKLGQSIDDIAAKNGLDRNAAMALVLKRTNAGYAVTGIDYGKIDAGSITDIICIDPSDSRGKQILMRDETYAFDYYAYPEGDARVVLHRHDENTGENLSNEYVVPLNVVNVDCTGAALKRLFVQIARDYVDTVGTDPEMFTWHDFIGIPTKFLAKYGVKPVENPNILCDVTVTANSPMLRASERT